MTISHMVLNLKGNPVHCNSPAAVKRWLAYQVKNRPEALGYAVGVWDNRKHRFNYLTATEYLSASEPEED